MNKYVPCNLCNSDNGRELLQLNSFFVNKCQTCGLVYVNPQPSKDQIISHYFSRYNPIPSLESKILKKGKRKLQVIERKIEKGKLLDVGCSYGIFLDAARRRGWKVKGVEIANGPAKYARDQGIDIVKRGLVDAGFLNGEFDVITMWHVLEHTSNPFSNLLEANRILKKGGVIFLTTPNIDSLVAKFCGKYWSWLDPPTHLYYFTPKTIVRLLEKAGFTCLYLKTREGDSGNPLYRILRSMLMRVSLRNSTQKEEKSGEINCDINTNGFQSFLKELIKNIANSAYILLSPLFWIAWKFNLGTEILVCAQKTRCGSENTFSDIF